MAIENDGIVGNLAFMVGGGGDSGFATEVTPLVTITVAEYRELCGKAALYDAMCASERGEETPPLPSEVEGATDEEPPRRP